MRRPWQMLALFAPSEMADAPQAQNRRSMLAPRGCGGYVNAIIAKIPSER